jgi:hypothetical protein
LAKIVDDMLYTIDCSAVQTELPVKVNLAGRDIIVDLLQQIEDLKVRREQVIQLIERHTAMVKKLAPLYDKAVQQLEEAVATKLEIDTLLGYTEQRIIDAEANLKHSAEDGQTE